MHRLAATLAPALAAPLVVLAACATAPGRTPPRAPAPDTARETAPADRVLTARDLERLDPDRSLYDAVAGIRPSFLRYQGTEPTVYVNGARVGTVGALRDIPVRWVVRVQLLASMDAAQLHGASRGAAAIEVTTRAAR